MQAKQKHVPEPQISDLYHSKHVFFLTVTVFNGCLTSLVTSKIVSNKWFVGVKVFPNDNSASWSADRILADKLITWLWTISDVFGWALFPDLCFHPILRFLPWLRKLLDTYWNYSCFCLMIWAK